MKLIYRERNKGKTTELIYWLLEGLDNRVLITLNNNTKKNIVNLYVDTLKGHIHPKKAKEKVEKFAKKVIIYQQIVSDRFRVMEKQLAMIDDIDLFLLGLLHDKTSGGLAFRGGSFNKDKHEK